MTRRSAVLAAVTCLVWMFSGNAAQSAEESREWQTVTLIEQDGFSFRLKHLTKASIVDQQWLQLEWENIDSDMEVIGNPHFRIEYETQPTGYPASSLVGGINWHNLLVEIARETDTRERPYPLLREGTVRRIIEPISDAATGSLPYPAKEGVRYKGIVHFWVTMSVVGGWKKVHLEAPRSGVPFYFTWVQPPESEIDNLERRLRNWLAEPDDRSQKIGWATARIFEVPAVTDRFTDDELADAIISQRGHTRALEALHRRDPRNRRVIEWYIAQMKEDPLKVHILKWSPFWTDELKHSVFDVLKAEECGYLSEVVRGVNRHLYAAPLDWNHPKDAALRILKNHQEDWQDDAELSAIVENARRERQYRRLAQDVGHWIYLARWLLAIVVCLFAWRFQAWVRRRRKQKALLTAVPLPSAVLSDGSLSERPHDRL